MSLKERNNNIYIKINKKENDTKWRIAVFGNRKIKKSLGMTTFTDALMEFKTIMFILFDGLFVKVAATSFILWCLSKNTATKDAAIWAFGNTSVKKGWRWEKIRSAKPAEILLRQNVPMPYIAVMPVGRRHTDKALRITVSAQNDHLPLSVTFEEPKSYSKVSNWHLGIRKIQMLKLIQIGWKVGL